MCVIFTATHNFRLVKIQIILFSGIAEQAIENMYNILIENFHYPVENKKKRCVKQSDYIATSCMHW